MKKLTSIIVDDEPLALSLLRSQLEACSGVEVIAECKNGRHAIEVVQRMAPELMFLDIEMPGLNGFDVVKALQGDVMPMVVFATAYDRYAVSAFDMHAVDYLLKPFDQKRLQLSVLRAAERSQISKNGVVSKNAMISAFNTINSKKIKNNSTANAEKFESLGVGRKIAIKDDNTITMVPIRDIDWIDAAGDYMCVHVVGKTHILRSTMKDLLEKLDASQFKRVHRSTVVNLDRIEQVVPHAKGEYFLTLAGGARIKVSRNYRDSIKSFIAKHK